MGGNVASGNCCRCNYDPILELAHLTRCLGDDILGLDCINQSLWC